MNQKILMIKRFGKKLFVAITAGALLATSIPSGSMTGYAKESDHALETAIVEEAVALASETNAEEENELILTEEDSAYSKDNLDFEFTTVEGKKVSSKADGKPKVIVFFRIGCMNCYNVITSLSNQILDFDVVLVEANLHTASETKSYAEECSAEHMTFCAEGNTAMNKYCSYLNYNMKTYPAVVYIDQDNKIQYMTEGAVSVTDYATQYLGTAEKKSEYAVIYSGTYNGGNLSYKEIKKNVDYFVVNDNSFDTYDFTSGTFSKASFEGNGEFLGWNTKADGSGTTYKPGDRATFPGSDITLYPMFSGDSAEASASPNASPSAEPSTSPETSPSVEPSTSPDTNPSAESSTSPEASPSAEPSTSPEVSPSAAPSVSPDCDEDCKVNPDALTMKHVVGENINLYDYFSGKKVGAFCYREINGKNTNIKYVKENGLLKIRKVGTFEIWPVAAYKDTAILSGYQPIIFTVTKPKFSRMYASYVGQQLNAKDYLLSEQKQLDASIPVRYESSKPTVATVDQNGKITIVGKGSTTIKAYVGKSGAVYRNTLSVKFPKVKEEFKVIEGKKKNLTIGNVWSTADIKWDVKKTNYYTSLVKNKKTYTFFGVKQGASYITVYVDGQPYQIKVMVTDKKGNCENCEITAAPSATPSSAPSDTPSDTPSSTPSDTPSSAPSDTPSSAPSDTPSSAPSATPSSAPSGTPSSAPSATPVASQTPSASPTPSPVVDPTYKDTLKVNYQTVEEIEAFMEAHPVTYINSYAETPSSKAPYSVGLLDDASLNSSLNALNNLRYIAGIPADVILNEEYCRIAQGSSLVNAANRSLSHYPAQPSDMDDELFNYCYSAASKCNISMGRNNIMSSIYTGWLWDASSASNVECVGHRRWMLDPRMEEVGFGQVDAYGSLYVRGYSAYSTTASEVAWPAQNTPAFLMTSNLPWSFCLNSTIDASTTEVKLIHLNDGKVWNFSSKSADGYFNVNNDGYGYLKAIIFRPEGTINYKAGDVFDVEITSGDKEYKYSVVIF